MIMIRLPDSDKASPHGWEVGTRPIVRSKCDQLSRRSVFPQSEALPSRLRGLVIVSPGLIAPPVLAHITARLRNAILVFARSVGRAMMRAPRFIHPVGLASR